MSDFLTQVVDFAHKAHDGHVRKYTGEPYTNHLRAVANLVQDHGGDETAVAVAWLHDTVEDVGVTFTDLQNRFGEDVAKGVFWLTDTDTSLGNRKTRKMLDAMRLAAAPDWVKTVKLADLFDNTHSIVAHDPKFAKVYLAEKAMLLGVMKGGNADLRKMVERNLE